MGDMAHRRNFGVPLPEFEPIQMGYGHAGPVGDDLLLIAARLSDCTEPTTERRDGDFIRPGCLAHLAPFPATKQRGRYHPGARRSYLDDA